MKINEMGVNLILCMHTGMEFFVLIGDAVSKNVRKEETIKLDGNTISPSFICISDYIISWLCSTKPG
jgi:hypothetical protein